MQTFLKIQTDVTATILLGIIYFIARKRMDKNDKLNNGFLSVVPIVLAGLIIECLLCIIGSLNNPVLAPTSILLHLVLLSVISFLAYFWCIHISSLITPSRKHNKSNNIFLLLPLLFVNILILLSPIYGFIMNFDSNNVFQRGSIFVALPIISNSYLIYSFGILLRNKSRIVYHDLVPLMVFSIVPIVASLIELLLPELKLMWSSTAFSLIIVDILLEQRMVNLDSLTGAWTRNSFDLYISQQVKQNSNFSLGIIFMDLDNLKTINDIYGHNEGDYALRTVAKLIKKSLSNTDKLIRLGGDEFVAIVDYANHEILNDTVNRIHKLCENYNKNSSKKYKLSCSIGSDIFNHDYTNINQFMQHVDSLMYDNKRKKKQNRNLPSCV